MKKTAKRMLCTVLAAAMILSVSIVAAIPAAAVDGLWNVFGTATEYAADFEGVPTSRPGYEYTEEGLHMIPANWTNQAPYGTFQTKEKMDIKNGIYIKVRIDNFNYDSEKWFDFHIWDSVNISPGSKNNGQGAQAMIRPGEKKNVGGVDWYIEDFKKAGKTTDSVISKDFVSHDEEGRVVLEFIVSWDGETFSAEVNGAKATPGTIEYMNEKWGGSDSMAYVGFSLQNSTKNGTVEATILKFGTSKETATTPLGDDRQEPENFDHIPAEIMDASTIPAGQPGIMMNASVAGSDIMTKPNSLVGAAITANDDNSAHIVTPKESADSGEWKVKYDISYSIEDFPGAVALVKNLCTCRDEVCYANETCHMYLCTGEAIQPSPENKVEYLDISEPIFVGEDTYLMFSIDMSDEYAPFEATGRINSARVDFIDIDYQTPGMNEFDVCYMAFFRNVEEAQAYAYNYIGTTGDNTPGADDDNTETNETEASTDNATEAPTTNETEAPTTGNNNNTTNNTNDSAENEGGCGSVVGFGAIAVVATAAAVGFVTFKKKED